MNPQQLTAIVTALRASADPTVVAALAGRTDQVLADWLNADASPVVKGWIKAVTSSMTDEACDWTQFDSIVTGKRDSWGFFLRLDSRDFSRNKVRKWITDVWGNATAGSVSEAILLAGVENMSRAEQILGGIVRTTGTVTATDRNFVGDVELFELSTALNA